MKQEHFSLMAEMLDPDLPESSEDIESEATEEAEPGFPGDDLDIEPWPDPVDGVELLDRLVETFKTYLSLDEGVAEVLAFWSVYTHAIDACQFAPRLFLKSPVPRCGKTTALGVLGHVTRYERTWFADAFARYAP